MAATTASASAAGATCAAQPRASRSASLAEARSQVLQRGRVVAAPAVAHSAASFARGCMHSSMQLWERLLSDAGARQGKSVVGSRGALSDNMVWLQGSSPGERGHGWEGGPRPGLRLQGSSPKTSRSLSVVAVSVYLMAHAKFVWQASCCRVLRMRAARVAHTCARHMPPMRWW
eukprot:364930-Chlamydomonas_euryale.AAC.28